MFGPQGKLWIGPGVWPTGRIVDRPRWTDVTDQQGNRWTDDTDRQGNRRTDVTDRQDNKWTDVTDRQDNRWTNVIDRQVNTLVNNAPDCQYLGYVAAHNKTPKLCLLLFLSLIFFMVIMLSITIVFI